jgi:hypothetical protein
VARPWSPALHGIQKELHHAVEYGGQGLTLVHYLAQRKRFLWARGCICGLDRGYEGVSGGFRGFQEVSGGFRECPGCILCQERLRLS